MVNNEWNKLFTLLGSSLLHIHGLERYMFSRSLTPVAYSPLFNDFLIDNLTSTVKCYNKCHEGS